MEVEAGNTWPEQEAVNDWVNRMELEGFTHEELHDLKTAVTAPRLEVQARLSAAREAVEAAIERLDWDVSDDGVNDTLKILQKALAALEE